MNTTKTCKKTDFLDKMQFLLSFQYSESECKNILTDYEEWFQEENRNGKSDTEICFHMGSPAEIVKKITAETKSDVSKLSILMHNCFLQFLVITGIRIFADLAIFYYCERTNLHYFFFAVFINAVYFAYAMAAVNQDASVHLLCRENYGIMVCAAAALSGNLMVWKFAADPRTGPYAVFVLTILVYILCASTVIHGGWRVMKKEAEVYMLALHATGLISMLLYSISQYHIFTTDRGQFVRTFLAGSIGIYLEAVVLAILFYLWKRHTKGDC